MKTLKKLFALVISTLLCLSCVSLFACGGANSSNSGEEEKTKIEVYAPDGAPALAIAKFIATRENFGTDADFNYHVVAASSIGAAMNTGSGDIVVAPVNLASKLYAGKGYKAISVLTHGNLYLMAKESQTLQGLVGKVVGVVNIANVPGLTFKALLKANGIEFEESDTAVAGKVALKGYADGAALIAALKQNVVTVGLLPEPAANKLTTLGVGYTYALDIQAVFSETNSYPQAVVMIKSEILEKYPQLASGMREKFAGAVDFIKNDTESVVNAVNGVLAEGVTASLTTANLNATVIDNCKIFWQDGETAKAEVVGYINKIVEIEPQSANAVGEDFFI